ncbi:MAG: hypothetical protein Q9174_002433 [Haloplaca sp. 1 TL-2023]
MNPRRPLPFSEEFQDVEEYISSILSFVTSSDLFKNVCGGVHILEFLTRDPDLYTGLLPGDWRQFFETLDMAEILNLLLRDDLTLSGESEASSTASKSAIRGSKWCNGLRPPDTLIGYIKCIRLYALDRDIHAPNVVRSADNNPSRQVTVGMKPKKIHEVSNLARYVHGLSTDISSEQPGQVSHFIDFGSGQNYLGRALASPPYEKRVVALESKPLNIDGARGMDVLAKLAEKEVILRNKKQYRLETDSKHKSTGVLKPADPLAENLSPQVPGIGVSSTMSETQPQSKESNIQYIQTLINSGDLSSIISLLNQPTIPLDTRLMVISLHSCGNLLHHGLRSLILNPSVHALALVGCCYNLLTERLPPLRPPPRLCSTLRTPNPRLQATSSACDPHGFPMSNRLLHYPHPNGQGSGIRFNITARMMAVQAPANWTREESDGFFTKHFYRALFQKIMVDKGVIAPQVEDPEDVMGKKRGGSPVKNPIVLGSLRKSALISFTAYVRAAITKLEVDEIHGPKIREAMHDITDKEIGAYEANYGHKKKELSIVWSLMAFSAQVVESVIVMDRWLWLREQEEVKDCWVESIFDYGISPRNLVVVGIKG